MNRKGYPNVVRAIAERPWAILPGKLEAIVELVAMRANGVELSREEIEARVANGASGKPAGRVRGIQVIPIQGVISPRANLFSEFSGGTSVEGLRNAFSEAMNDDDVSAIVFDVDSPGGSVDLVPELAADIRAARGTKPIVAVANTLMASAAYHLASQADEVFATPSGDVGAIGVYAVHQDFSKALEQEGVDVTLVKAGRFKTEGNPYEPLGEEARSHIQELVDASYELFVSDVAEARGASVEDVTTGFGEGRVLHAKAAVAAGLADGVQTFDQTIRALLATGETGRAVSAGGLSITIAGKPNATATELEAHVQHFTGKKFVDEAEDARRAVAGVVTRLGSLAEIERGRLTTAKREVVSDLRNELIELANRMTSVLLATAPAEAEEKEEESDDRELELAAADASLAAAGARLRLKRGG